MKKFLWTLLCVGWTAASPAIAQPGPVDSLVRALEAETDLHRRVDILLNLKDLTESTNEEMRYARALCRAAREAGDGFALGASLGSLASYYIATPALRDSLQIVLADAEPLLRGGSMEGITTYYRMVEFARRLQTADAAQSVHLSRDYIDSVRTLPDGDVYEQASRLFLRGLAAYRLGSADGRMQIERGLPYWSDEAVLLERMRPTARRNFHANLITCLIPAYGKVGDREALIRTADDYLAMLDAYYRDPEIVRRRPFIAREMSYQVCYYMMCTSSVLDERQTQGYYERYRCFMASTAAGPGSLLTDKYGFYSISAEFYDRRGDRAHALAYTDSLILLTRQGDRFPQLAGLYGKRARLLEAMGRYRDACGVYAETLALRDSLASQQYDRKVGEMEVLYGLEKAERDKALLLAQKRVNSLYFAAVLLLLAAAAIVYLWHNLRRIERLRRQLAAESLRAQESDRLKRDFMGSMSHEIRTPLNAINGFAELIAEGGLRPGEAVEFAQIVRDNTRQFTALINDMMEVAQLDNSGAELPKQPMDICRIIREEAAYLPVKEGVECRLVFAEPEIVVALHRGYASMLVRELLKNAMKFTARGSVTVECSRIRRGKLTLTVTDTGCGVPIGSAEKIFERFYKEDSFGPGLGLGLSLCRLIVEKSGGTIVLDTSYTEGARFVVELPAE